MVLVLAGPPQVGAVGAGCLRPVGGDDDPVQIHVRQACLPGGGEGLPKAGSMSGEHVDPFVQVSVDGLGADGVVGGELGDASAVDEPAQDQHRLGEAAQRPAAPAGAAPAPLGVQQAGQEQHRLPPHVERGGVCDT